MLHVVYMGNIVDSDGFIQVCIFEGLYSGFLVLRPHLSRDQILLTMVRIGNYNKTLSF